MFVTGLGGTFLITGSKTKQHIMPDFSKIPIISDQMVEEWLRFYQMNPPLVAVGTLVTNDPVSMSEAMGQDLLV